MLENNSLQTHIATQLIPGYQKRWTVMIEAIERVLVSFGVKVSRVSLERKNVFGGYFIWLHLPEEVNAKAVAAVAKEDENLIVSEGELFEVYGDEKAVKLGQWVRVCFAWEEIETLVEGIERLGRAIEKVKGQEVLPQVAKQTDENLREELGEYK
jgi:DNA-binding transcriptional MocR family regulator